MALNDIFGIWRGKMNAIFYSPYVFYLDVLPRYWGPPVDPDDPAFAGEPTIWFGMKISYQSAYLSTLTVFSGEVEHFSNGSNEELDARSLPVNGFVDVGIGDIQLTFYRLFGMQATFKGYFHPSDNHIVGVWTETR